MKYSIKKVENINKLKQMNKNKNSKLDILIISNFVKPRNIFVFRRKIIHSFSIFFNSYRKLNKIN